MFSKYLLNFLIVGIVADVAFACNGYKAKILKLENCAGPEGIITVDSDFSVKLNKKCELVPTGCIVNKAFNTAVSKFKITKDGVVIKEGKHDMCAMAEQAPNEAKDLLKLFGAPPNCPVPEEKICANDHKVDLSKYKAMLSMAKGNIVIDSEVQHDTGKSCIHVELEITKS
ncbi:uncharacterized protein LOC119662494 [Teleopsis dalmanni]|uniref:uncharacterized protein LOC119662494 n=1 Tax=Teleopsis dalmanni TaxID=139649 RepID=UPI0018CE91B0|nr:uncharacterized protein LOC119662494 [Teleopsis dalmanni]